VVQKCSTQFPDENICEQKGIHGKWHPITDENKVREVVDKFRSKYSAENIARYYSKLDAAVEFLCKNTFLFDSHNYIISPITLVYYNLVYSCSIL
jgi:hypothetical protein